MKNTAIGKGFWTAVVIVALTANCGTQRLRDLDDDGSDDPDAGDNPPGRHDMAHYCEKQCAPDGRSVTDCHGITVSSCLDSERCDDQTFTCENACDVAFKKKQSVGCEYYATFMAQYLTASCFASFVANTWDTPAHITVEYQGKPLPVGSFAYLPSGAGTSISYMPYDPIGGLPPGGVAILFLAGPQGGGGSGMANCPVTAAFPSLTAVNNTYIGDSFHISTDVPVVAYQINPYGGGSAATTGASLLLPVSAWDTNYVAANAYENDPGLGDASGPSLNIIAAEDDTHVTMQPISAVTGGSGIPSAPAGGMLDFVLNKGQQAQITQAASLTGSAIQTDKPVGFMAGQACTRVPVGVSYCDHSEQMLPPVKALGSEYVGVMYRPRAGEPGIWRIVGAVNGTILTWSSDVGGPTSINLGEVKEFDTGTPFVVKSQDSDHPFLLLSYMSGSSWKPGLEGLGDPDFVIGVPPQQYMTDYVFFSDPTYPETNLVLVRAKDGGVFSDVTLDCAGVVGGWQPVGDYEWTRVDLSTGDFRNVGSCSNGRHEIKSMGRFGLWIWGWGTPSTNPTTGYVSYGYPGGMNVLSINPVVIPPG